MASSRRWSPVSERVNRSGLPFTRNASPTTSATLPVRDAVRRFVGEHVADGATIAIALSGGRDSVVLLDATIAHATPRGISVVAIHVHHALSSNADGWSQFCASLCERRGVRFVERRVNVPRIARTSVEAEARSARYGALADVASSENVAAVLLAHHQDDQAETVLLQLLRGAGPRGLSAMPHLRVDDEGRKWLRPLLDVPRSAIDAYAAACALEYVDDDSNVDTRYARNALRRDVVPQLAKLARGYPATVARAAALQADALRLADDLAHIDAAYYVDGGTLARNALIALPPHRARNLLRWFLADHGLAPPSSARLEAMLRQLATSRADARVRVVHAGSEVGVHRYRIVVHRAAPPPFELGWSGESSIALPHGVLQFERTDGDGLSAALLQSACVVVRSRRGGERIQLASNRPRQALKSLLQRAAMPDWARAGLPLVFCDDVLACVPQIGIDARFAACADEAAFRVIWTERVGGRPLAPQM